MGDFVFPNGEWMLLEDLAFYYDTVTEQEALLHVVGQIIFENGQSGLPSWWKRRYRNAIIEVAIDDAYVLSCGVRHDPIHDQWYPAKDVPIGRVGFEEEKP